MLCYIIDSKTGGNAIRNEIFQRIHLSDFCELYKSGIKMVGRGGGGGGIYNIQYSFRYIKFLIF